MKDCVYLFLDESGNFDFSPNGTKHLVLASVSMRRQFPAVVGLDSFRYDCLEDGVDLEYFHFAIDRAPVRDKVFDLIAADLDAIRIDCLILEKRKARPELLEGNSWGIYKWMLGYFMRRLVAAEEEAGTKNVVAITDSIPNKKKRNSIEKEIKGAVGRRQLPGIQYRLIHHESRSHFGLQIADYCCWAIQRKWEKGNLLGTTASSRRFVTNSTYSSTVRSTTTSCRTNQRYVTSPTTPLLERAPRTLVIGEEPLEWLQHSTWSLIG